jgi:hypothetical protein
MQQPTLVSRHVISCAAFILATAPLGAQQSHSMRVSIDGSDSVAHIVNRVALARARYSITSRDGAATLLLMDTTIVAQMTDREMARMDSHEATDTISGVMERMIARMALGAVKPLLDHGIAYHLRDLADARYADGRLQLIRKNGEEVFKGTEIGHGPLMEAFASADAKEFAKRAKEARAKLK